MFFLIPALIAGVTSAATAITTVGEAEIVAAGAAVAAYNLTKDD